MRIKEGVICDRTSKILRYANHVTKLIFIHADLNRTVMTPGLINGSPPLPPKTSVIEETSVQALRQACTGYALAMFFMDMSNAFAPVPGV